MGHDQFARFREPSRPNLKVNSNEYEYEILTLDIDEFGLRSSLVNCNAGSGGSGSHI